MIVYREDGPEGAPLIVLLHGGGLSRKMWLPQIERLPQYHILTPDLPEQGQSIDLHPFTLNGAAEQVALMLDKCAPGQQANLVGLSLGGAVALTLLRERPDLVKSVFVTGTADKLGPVLGRISLWSGKLYNLIPAQMLVEASMKQFGIPQQYRELVASDLLATSNAEFVGNFTRSLMVMELPTQAKVPVLVAVGEKETIPAKNAARKLVQGIPGAKGVRVAGVGHVWNLQKPDLFTDTITAWVEGNPLPKELVAMETK